MVGVPSVAASTALGQVSAVSGGSEASIEADRPGNGNATTVPTWNLHIESGLIAYAFDERSSGESQLVRFPPALRFGVLSLVRGAASWALPAGLGLGA